MSRMLDALKRLEAELESDSAAKASGSAPIATNAQIEARLAHTEELVREERVVGPGRPTTAHALESLGPEGKGSYRGPEAPAQHRTASPAQPATVAPHYAQMRERILTQVPRDRSAALLFVHPGGVEDVSTTVAELAVAMTEAMPGDILAIDANVGPRAAAAGTGGGLIDVLAEKTEWYTAVLPTRNPRVVLLPGGTWPGSVEVPDDARVRRHLDVFRSRFEMVLIDVGSIENPMAKVLARSCDACYVVLALARTRQRDINSTLKRLRQAGGRVSGCILTGATQAEAQSARS